VNPIDRRYEAQSASIASFPWWGAGFQIGDERVDLASGTGR
jgi:hypothetical protein